VFYLDKFFNLRIIPKNPTIGLVIGTHGSVPYIHLFLESAKRNFPNMPILIHDDCSEDRHQLESLAREYNCEFFTNNFTRGHGAGDISSYVSGLRWAKGRFDLLVKMSRRFIPFFDWTESLKELAYRTQFFTFTNECKNFKFGVRTECVGMYVKSWFKFLLDLESLMRSDVDAEREMYQLIIKIQASNDLVINKNYVYRNCKLEYKECYGVWEEIGNNRMLNNPNILWHDICGPKDYYKRALDYGINEYSLADFVI